MKILLIERDQSTLSLLKNTLETHGYSVDLASTAAVGLKLAIADDYQLVILNARLAGLSKVHLCQQLRTQGYYHPILLLLEDASTDGIAGLEAGANDYVIQPYNPVELMTRIRTLLNRQQLDRYTSLHWEDLCLIPASAEVTYRGKPLALTPKEFSLLELFLSHPQRVFSRTTILDRIWAFDVLPHESTVTNHIKELRQKLKAAGITAEMIETVYGLGYRLKPPPKLELVDQPEPPSAPAPSAPQASPIVAGVHAPTVLVVDPDPGLLSALHYLLQPWGLHVAALQNPTQIWEWLNQIGPDLLILALEMGNGSGIHLCRTIRQDPQWGDLPILVMTADPSAEVIQKAFAAGADDFVSKPIVGPELVTRVVSRLEPQQPFSLKPAPVQLLQTPPLDLNRSDGPEATLLKDCNPAVQATYGNILLVDDQPENLRTLSQILKKQGYKVRKALRGSTALDAIHSQPPDLVILDVRMPEMNGYEVCALLKAQAVTREIPILFLSALDDTANKLQGFAVGGADYITKPFHEEEVLARIKHQLIILQQKRQLASRNQQLQREIQERQQSNVTLQQVQAALQESQSEFYRLFHAVPVALGVISRDDRWLQANPALCRLLGYTRMGLLGTPISAYVTTGQEGAAYGLHQRLWEQASREGISLTFCGQSHQTIQTWVTTWPVTLEGTRSLVAQFQEISHIRRA